MCLCSHSEAAAHKHGNVFISGNKVACFIAMTYSRPLLLLSLTLLLLLLLLM